MAGGQPTSTDSNASKTTTSNEKTEKEPILISTYIKKGGVGKTTSTYNLAYLLAEFFGLRVLMVDADSQCSLTDLINAIDICQNSERAAELYDKCNEAAKEGRLQDLGNIFRPITENQDFIDLDRAKQVELLPVHSYKNLFYLPGSKSLDDMNEALSLGIAGVGLNQQLPPLMSRFFREVGRLNKIDLVLFDLNPSMHAFNQSLIMGCDYFFIPFLPDFYCLRAIQDFSSQMTRLKDERHFGRFSKKDKTDKNYMQAEPKLLGLFPQRTKIRKKINSKSEEPVQSYHAWMKDNYKAAETLSQELKALGMVANDFELSKIAGVPDFASAGLDVQASGRPISDLKYEHMHRITDGNSRPLNKMEVARKNSIAKTYLKVLACLFRNMAEEHRQRLGEDFLVRINTHIAMNDNIDMTKVIPSASVESPVRYQHDTHWYNDDEINTLLRHYLGQVDNLVLLDAMDATQLGGNTLTGNLQDFKNNHEQFGGQRNSKIILPVNLGQRHWVMVYIYYPQTGHPDIFYFDPIGDEMPTVLRRTLEHVFPESETQSIEERLQDDGYNCGPWIVEAAVNIINNNGSIPPLGYNIDEARARHQENLGIIRIAELRDNRPITRSAAKELTEKRKAEMSETEAPTEKSTKRVRFFLRAPASEPAPAPTDAENAGKESSSSTTIRKKG